MGEWRDLHCPLRAIMAAARPRWAGVQHLLAMGADARFVGELLGRFDLGIGQVSIGSDGLFVPGGPDRRLLLAVRDASGAVSDVVACASHDPDEWALLTGAGSVLGEDVLEDAARAEHGARVRLFGNPIAWLAGAGSGACVLDWKGAALSQLRALGAKGTLLCDPGASAALKNLLAFGNLPQVRETRAVSAIGRAA